MNPKDLNFWDKVKLPDGTLCKVERVNQDGSCSVVTLDGKRSFTVGCADLVLVEKRA